MLQSGNLKRSKYIKNIITQCTALQRGFFFRDLAPKIILKHSASIAITLSFFNCGKILGQIPSLVQYFGG